MSKDDFYKYSVLVQIKAKAEILTKMGYGNIRIVPDKPESTSCVDYEERKNCYEI